MTNLQDNWSNLFATATRMLQKGQTSSQQKDTHEGESLRRGGDQLYPCAKLGGTHNQSQGSSAFRIDEEQSRDGEHDLNSTITKRCVQGLCWCVADSFKDC
jgi:hypothetical protein